MPTFCAPRNPNFNLSSRRLKGPIVFTDHHYTTDHPEEVRALRRCASVEEVKAKPRKKRRPRKPPAARPPVQTPPLDPNDPFGS